MRQRISGTCLPATPAMRQRVPGTCLPVVSARREAGLRGRDAITGRFITVGEAKRRKNTTIVETIGLPMRWSNT
jgi:hypothetical protein